MKKAITLINPKGERKDLTNIEFFDLQTQFANSKAFARWSEARKIEGWIKHGMIHSNVLHPLNPRNKEKINVIKYKACNYLTSSGR